MAEPTDKELRESIKKAAQRIHCGVAQVKAFSEKQEHLCMLRGTPVAQGGSRSRKGGMPTRRQAARAEAAARQQSQPQSQRSPSPQQQQQQQQQPPAGPHGRSERNDLHLARINQVQEQRQ